MRLRKTTKALAMTTDCNGRFCYVNPREGARSAVAEAARNIVCSGGKPLAITNCLNFGNPYKPEIYYGFSEAIAGMGEACRTLETPVTGGNVSFYNEDPERAVFPSPVIGMIGLIEHIDHITTQWFAETGDAVFLLGRNREELGASEYLHAIYHQTRGDAPAVDLEFEKRLQDALLSAIREGFIRSAHDCSEGGLAVALAECCISNKENMVGATIKATDDMRADCLLFGESPSRVIVSCSALNADRLNRHFQNSSVACERIGSTGGEKLIINDLISAGLSDLSDAWYGSMSRMMETVG